MTTQCVDLVMGEHIGLTATDVYAGTYRVDWLRPDGQTGYPWTRGVLRLEHRPDLQPLQARGMSAPGTLRQLSQNPYIQSAVQRPLRALATTPLRLERPELPEWATLEDARAAERQWSLVQRVWHRISDSRGALSRFIREVVEGAAYDGFYLGEIVCDEVEADFEGAPYRYLMPRLPELRAAWTVRHWLTQAERPIGVVLEVRNSADFEGNRGPSQVVVPWAKLIHVAANQTGSNLEGRAWVRPIANQVEILNQMGQLEALAVEVNALGELWFVLPEGHPDATGLAATLQAHLKRRRAAQVVGGVLPFGSQIQTISPMTMLPDFGPAMDRLIQAISVGLDASDKLIALDGGGSYAARADATADQQDGYDNLAQEYVAAPLEELLLRAIQLNFPGDVAASRVFAPRIAWGVIEERDLDTYVQTLAIAAQTGLLTPEDLANARPVILELLDLPQPGDVGEAGIAQDAVGSGDDPWTGEYVTSAVVASKFGVRPSTVVGWAKRGLVRARKIGSRWTVDLNSVREMLRSAPVAGAPEPPPEPAPEIEASTT